MTPTSIAEQRCDAVAAGLVDIGSRTIMRFQIAGGKHHGAIGEAGGDAVCRAVETAIQLGVPIVGVLDTSGADIREGVTALHAWGRIARTFANASGVVPTILVVAGPCVSGPALLLGLVDVIVMTDAAFAYVSGPDAVEEFTGQIVDRHELGGVDMHELDSGVCHIRAVDEDDAWLWVEWLLSYLPNNNVETQAPSINHDPIDRPSAQAAAVVPHRATASYDVRTVLRDVMDADSFLELQIRWAPNIVVGFGRLDGHSVGIVANQPQTRAGSIDIEASRKAAQFVQWCDAFNVPIVTFVDTPGFEPGKVLEWRGMIRQGAELVHAYGEASVPRLCIVLRKAYGGAYIVMDSKGLGNDWCGAWPGAEIAVMGAPGAVQILYRRDLLAIENPAERVLAEEAMIAEYEARFATPHQAADRGFVDAIIDPLNTRLELCQALRRLSTKRESLPHRRHSNGPL
jgi:acetyl-CoA carboxylase carboxyltransferase component